MPKPCKIPDRIDPSAVVVRVRPPSKLPPVHRMAVAVDQKTAADMLDIHPDTLDELRRRGEIRPFKIGSKLVRYLVSELQRYGETQMQKQYGQRIASDVGESPSSAVESSTIRPHEGRQFDTIGCDSAF